MRRAIIIETCNDCPRRGHRGGFGKIGYIPRCGAVRDRDNTLPFTTSVSGRFMNVTASCTGEIPDWCPLETIE